MEHKTYVEYCQGNPDIPLFMRPYWLDAVAPNQWQGLVVKEGDEVKAAWALHRTKLRGMDALVLPPMTPFTGIYLNVANKLPQKQNLQRQMLIQELIDKLPGFSIFEQKVRFTLQDWSPFYWSDFRQETRYTFRFPYPDPDAIMEHLTKSFRRKLRTAQRVFYIDHPDDPTELYELVARVYDIRGEQIAFGGDVLERAYEAVASRGQCRIYRASDEQGPNSVIFCVWDNDTMYYLLGGRVSSNTRGSTNLLLWQAIGDAAAQGLSFDFEGSMIKGVHRFFQGFAAELTPYHFIYRYRNLARVKYL